MCVGENGLRVDMEEAIAVEQLKICILFEFDVNKAVMKSQCDKIGDGLALEEPIIYT